MPKNIIICCDGTDNKLTINKNTNVIHLYSCLTMNEKQIAYYSPGVGTIAPNGVRNWLLRKWYIIRDLISASSLESNVMDAYIYIMNNYEPGDKIYLFGFSRGAYTVRMLSGLIQMFGLLHKGNQNHLRYALEIYSKGDKIFAIANAFKKRFSREIEIEFIGVWDTVVSAGGMIGFYKSFPYSRSLGIAKSVRHAVSIDERRKHYDFYEVSEKHNDLKEVFFAGVHSDVGGSYPVEGLSKIALEWMLIEASNKGLILTKSDVNRYLYGVNSNYQRPDYMQKTHNSATFEFKLFDLIPRLRFDKNSSFNQMKIDFRFLPLRKILNGSYIHESVYKKMEETSYNPKNIFIETSYYKKEVNGEMNYV